MNIQQEIAQQLNVNSNQVKAVLELFTDGCTIPFIARYRKEQTGSLDELQIQQIRDSNKRLVDFQQRKEYIISTIRELGKLSDELLKKINATSKITELEDLYRPFKKKKLSRAEIARNNGLLDLAKLLSRQEDRNYWKDAKKFINKNCPDEEACLQGARDIFAQWIADDSDIRKSLRRVFKEKSLFHSKVVGTRKTKEGADRFRDYFEYSEPINRIAAHRFLAIMRGNAEGFLRIKLRPDEEDAIRLLNSRVIRQRNKSTQQTSMVIEDAYQRLMLPSLEKEFLADLKAKADEKSIEVFSKNIRELLMTAPYGEQPLLGIDPGFRTGCKVVALSATGQLLDYFTIFPFLESKQEGDILRLKKLVRKYQAKAIAVGNGTAGKETQNFLKKIDFESSLQVVMVNESGASIYSASAIAREEFPDLDLTYRGSVSIARRLMDPLAELVKIDPKSIGVGQYQHDVNQKQLKGSLSDVVMSCVNAVGVELNTASPQLLSYVSGLGPALAKNIVEYRQENGAFTSRKQLSKVKRLGAKAFEQASGFLRIRNAANPLDSSAVHPERYNLLTKIARDKSCTIKELIEKKALRDTVVWKNYRTKEVGLPTLQDIKEELEKPGRDPRGTFENTNFREDLNSIEDLNTGMVLQGIVTNVTNFGAFVDIGVHQDGLVHVSQLKNGFVRDPLEVVQVNQKVKVLVTEIDIARKRISLSMKDAQ